MAKINVGEKMENFVFSSRSFMTQEQMSRIHGLLPWMMTGM